MSHTSTLFMVILIYIEKSQGLICMSSTVSKGQSPNICNSFSGFKCTAQNELLEPTFYFGNTLTPINTSNVDMTIINLPCTRRVAP